MGGLALYSAAFFDDVFYLGVGLFAVGGDGSDFAVAVKMDF